MPISRTRLRIEMLEGRDVPAILTGTEEIVDPIKPDAPTEVIVTEVVTTTEVIPTTDIPSEILQTTAIDAPAETETETETETEGEVITVTDELDGDSTLPAIDLEAFVGVDKAKPSVGDVVTFKFTIQNNGDIPATGAKLNAVLPEGVTFVSASAVQGSFDQETGDWTAGTVYPGGPVTLSIKAKIVERTELTATATITASDNPDSVAENNTGSKSVTPALAGVAITKSVSGNTLVVGSTVAFTIVVKNSGPGAARNLVMKDVLGPGLTFVKSETPFRGSFNPSSREWKITTLPSGAYGSIRILAVVKSTGKLTSTTTLLSGDGIDETRSRFEATASVYGTTVNNPSTWSYVTLGSAPKVQPAATKNLTFTLVKPAATTPPKAPTSPLTAKSIMPAWSWTW